MQYHNVPTSLSVTSYHQAILLLLGDVVGHCIRRSPDEPILKEKGGNVSGKNSLGKLGASGGKATRNGGHPCQDDNSTSRYDISKETIGRSFKKLSPGFFS